MLLKNLKFDYSFSPTSIGHNSLNINLNYAKFIFKLNYKMSTFKWNKYYSKIIYGSKVITKKVKKNILFLASFSKLFKYFWVVIASKLLWTHLLPSILIYGLGLCPVASFTGHVSASQRVQFWTRVRILVCLVELAIGQKPFP